VTTRRTFRLTRSRLGVAASIGLVVFGVVDASLPSPVAVNPAVSGLGPPTSPDTHLATAGTGTAATMPVRSLEETAAQRVAEDFVAATDETDPSHPEGETAERALLAPGLTVPSRLAWPEAWVAEGRRTTVVLDPPGSAVVVGSGQVAVVVTGRTNVATDAGPPIEVPVDERITLRLIGLTGSAPHWVVTNVGTGS
jgi:hypothetical protein